MHKILIIKDGNLPVVDMLDHKVLRSYEKDIASSYYERARRSLNISHNKDNYVILSNGFIPVQFRKHLPKGMRLATMADLARIIEAKTDILSGSYSDTGLVLRTAGDSHAPNDSLAKELAEQLNKRGIDLKTPKIIYFDALDLKEDKDSFYNLSYVLNEKAEFGKNIIDAPALARDYLFRIFDDKGVPIQDDTERKLLCSRKDGLSRFLVSFNSYVSSDVTNLAQSNGLGRLILVEDGKQ